MGKNVYYSKIADIYDQTRWLTEPIAEEVADFILTLVKATPETTFLEPGIGTGLNVLPLVRLGIYRELIFHSSTRKKAPGVEFKAICLR